MRTRADLAVPDPIWNPNNGEDGNSQHFWDCILVGLRKGVLKTKILNKVQKIREETHENASAFLEKIMKAYQKYTDIDPESPDNSKLINTTFLGQNMPVIQEKLWKWEGVLTLPISHLVDMAYKGFINHE